MFRPAPTWISVPDHEVYQILQAVHIQRAILLQYGNLESVSDVDETEYCESPASRTWSSSGQYTLPTPEMRSRYLTTTCLDLSPTDSRDLAASDSNFTSENSIPAGLHARLASRRVIRGEGNDWEDFFHPDSTDSSLTPLEEPSSGASLAATARSYTASDSTSEVQRILRSDNRNVVPILHVEVPWLYERTFDVMFPNFMTRYWQYEPTTRLPERPTTTRDQKGDSKSSHALTRLMDGKGRYRKPLAGRENMASILNYHLVVSHNHSHQIRQLSLSQVTRHPTNNSSRQDEDQPKDKKEEHTDAD